MCSARTTEMPQQCRAVVDVPSVRQHIRSGTVCTWHVYMVIVLVVVNHFSSVSSRSNNAISIVTSHCPVCLCSTMVIDQQSPYMQKLANSHVVPMNGSAPRRRRPTSAASTGRPVSAGVGRANKPKIDEKFIADPDLWDPITPHDNHQQKRPTSAPVYKRSLVHHYDDDDDDGSDDDDGCSDDYDGDAECRNNL